MLRGLPLIRAKSVNCMTPSNTICFIIELLSKVTHLITTRINLSHWLTFINLIEIFSTPEYGLSLLRELFNKSKTLFTCIGPHEYGITNQEKLDIGIQNSLHLLRQLIEEIQLARDSHRPCTRLFFTKESKVMCLLNIVLLCGLKCHVTPVQIEELDYLTQITFELYERKGGANEDREYSLRIEFSPGIIIFDYVLND